MERDSSRVRVRVAAEVVFFTIFWPAVVDDLVFLPLTLSLTAVPTKVPIVAVAAVTTALKIFDPMPAFFF